MYGIKKLLTRRLDLLPLDVLALSGMAGVGTEVTVGTKWCLEMDPYKRNAFRKLLPLSVIVAVTLSCQTPRTQIQEAWQ